MLLSIFVFFTYLFQISKAFILAILYLTCQFLVASFHPESFRWTTLLFSVGLVFIYVCMYHLVYIGKVFTVDSFIKLLKWMMLVYFVVCIIQQMFLILGISYFPLINLWKAMNGFRTNSLLLEPSHFARFMFVFYYAYVRCNEYKRGEDPFMLRELFVGEHKWVSIRFLWVMLTMGSGTAYVCLIAFALYFVRRYNWFYLVPSLLLTFVLILPIFEIEQLNRAATVANATLSLDIQKIIEADDSASFRIAPFINSIKADFTKAETWFGYGIDYAANNKLWYLRKSTLFDNYGFIFYLITLLFNFTCCYRFFSIETIFYFMGIIGGAGNNIHYAWEFMMIMTCVRYFYENRYELNELNNSSDN